MKAKGKVVKVLFSQFNVCFGLDKVLDLFVYFRLHFGFVRIFGQSVRQQRMGQSVGKRERLRLGNNKYYRRLDKLTGEKRA